MYTYSCFIVDYIRNYRDYIAIILQLKINFRKINVLIQKKGTENQVLAY